MHLHFKINFGRLASLLLTAIAGGALTSYVPERYKPIAEGVQLAALALHPSPLTTIAPTAQEGLAAVEAVTPLLPGKLRAPVQIAEQIAGVTLAGMVSTDPVPSSQTMIAATKAVGAQNIAANASTLPAQAIAQAVIDGAESGIIPQNLAALGGELESLRRAAAAPIVQRVSVAAQGATEGHSDDAAH